MKCSLKDTFYIDPDVDDRDSLTARATRMGLKTKGLLEEGVTVWVAAVLGREPPPDEAAAESLRGRRTNRIHRMQKMVQALAAPEVIREEQDGQGRVIDARARELGVTAMSDQAFRVWLEGQESKAAPKPATSKGKEPARRVMPHSRRVGIEGIKSYRQHRLVIKDLDGLESVRVKAFPPEVLRKTIVQKGAPPGISPFTTRDKWDREVIKMDKKIAQHGAGQVVFREKPRRGGWCECCKKQFVGKKSEHCASDAHQAAVAADPFFTTLLALQTWTRSDQTSGKGKDVAHVYKENSPFESMNSRKGGEYEVDAIMEPKEMNRRTTPGGSPPQITSLTREAIPPRSPPGGCQRAESKGILPYTEKEEREEGLYERGQSSEDPLMEAPIRCELGSMSPTRRRNTEKNSCDTMEARVGNAPGSETHAYDSHSGGEAGMYASTPQSAQHGRSSEGPLVEAPVRYEPGSMSPARRRSAEKDSCDTREARVGSIPRSETHACDSHPGGEVGMFASTPQSAQRGQSREYQLMGTPVRCEPGAMSPAGRQSTDKNSCDTREARVGSVPGSEAHACDSHPGGEAGTNARIPQSSPAVTTPAEAETSAGLSVGSCKTQSDDSSAAGKAFPSGTPSTIKTPGIHPNTPHSSWGGRKQSREMRMLADTPEFVSAQKRRLSSARRALRYKRRDGGELCDLEGNRSLGVTGDGEDTAAAKPDVTHGDASERGGNPQDIRARATSSVGHQVERKNRKTSESSSRKKSNGSRKARRGDQSNGFPERGNVSSSVSDTIQTSILSKGKRRKCNSSLGNMSQSLGLDVGAVEGGNTGAANNEVRVPDEGRFPPSKGMRARIVAAPSKPNSGVWRPTRVP